MVYRYLSILWLRSPCIIYEDYWFHFFNVWINLMSYFVQTMPFLLAGHEGQSTFYYICTGENPKTVGQEWLLESAIHESKRAKSMKLRGAANVVLFVTVLIHIFIGLRIKHYKSKAKHCQTSPSDTVIATRYLKILNR